MQRRSKLNSTTSSPLNSNQSNLNQTAWFQVNDDDAERSISRSLTRSFKLNASVNESSTTLAEAADSLSNCLKHGLKLFARNKINKDNAWKINIIDSFAKLLQKHHHDLANFQVAGIALEASAKVYGLRVDSLYIDVCRMSADLGRQIAKALSKKGNRYDNDDSEGEQNFMQNPWQNPNDENDRNSMNQQQGEQQPKAENVRQKKNVSTVTTNPESLNARLDTIALTDPFFAKLKSVIGNTDNPKRLMQNIIPTEDSKLKLRQNIPIWDSNEQQVFNLDEKINFKEPNKDRKITVVKTNFPKDAIARLNLRGGLSSSYRISNEPMERYDGNDSSFKTGNEVDNAVIPNTSHIELQFDINAAVEPVPLKSQSIVMDFGDMDNEDFEDMNEIDHNAIERCKSLRRQPVLIVDMQPESCLSLEYSYRPHDMIDQFWAGPSYWKFRKSRRANARSLGTKASHMSRTSDDLFAAPQAQQKPTRKRKIVKKKVACMVTREDFCDADDDIRDMLIKIDKKIKGTQLTNQIISKKWNTKKHKLPHNHKVQQDIFDKYLFASSIPIRSNQDVAFTENDEELAQYDYDNKNSQNYYTAANMRADNNQNFDMPPPLAPVDEIPDANVGAPENFEKSSIAFARRAKNVDMKQLKSWIWHLLEKKRENDPTQNPKFSETLKDLLKVLPRTIAENMSMPLAFYSYLHLANDKSLHLHQSDDKLNDFEVQFRF